MKHIVTLLVSLIVAALTLIPILYIFKVKGLESTPSIVAGAVFMGLALAVLVAFDERVIEYDLVKALLAAFLTAIPTLWICGAEYGPPFSLHGFFDGVRVEWVVISWGVLLLPLAFLAWLYFLIEDTFLWAIKNPITSLILMGESALIFFPLYHSFG